jgi:hypothetical protein
VLSTVREADTDGLIFCNVMFNDREGLKDCFGGQFETLDELDDMLVESMQVNDIQVPFVPITLAHAREVIAEAYQTTLQARRRLPISFLGWRYWLEGEGPEHVELRPLPDVPEDERDHLLEVSTELLDIEGFESWFFEKDDLGGYERRYLRLPERERNRDNPAVTDIIVRALKTIMTPAICRRISERLRRQAWLLAQCYKDPEIPLSALAAADDIADPNTAPQENPFLRGMLHKSLVVIAAFRPPGFPRW